MYRSSRAFGGVVWLALVISLSVLAGVASAQDGTLPTPVPGSQTRTVTSDDVNAIAKQMYCPVCENEPLDACRTAACQQWRAQIAQMLSEGQTEAQIKQYFVDRYGLRVLAQPPAEGNSLLLWVLPLVALVIGGVYVTLLIRRMRARGVAAEAASSTPVKTGGDAYVDRVEQDLKDY
jgi:cytochrome c-type biogenesis protein CcmH